MVECSIKYNFKNDLQVCTIAIVKTKCLVLK